MLIRDILSWRFVLDIFSFLHLFFFCPIFFCFSKNVSEDSYSNSLYTVPNIQRIIQKQQNKILSVFLYYTQFFFHSLGGKTDKKKIKTISKFFASFSTNWNENYELYLSRWKLILKDKWKLLKWWEWKQYSTILRSVSQLTFEWNE